jgi:DNA-binding response OmpR family regulator
MEGHLPDCDAQGLIMALRRLAMPPPTPIAILAHEGTPRERARFLWAGASAYVSDPDSISHINHMVGLLIEVSGWR